MLNVACIPSVKNSFEIGFGYTSGIGSRVKILWKKPWINNCGHSLENNFTLSALEQFFSFNYKIPLLNNPLEEYYLLQVGWIHENVHKLQSNVTTINVSRYWDYINDWQKVINLHIYADHCIRRDSLTKIIMLICPGININRIQQRGSMMPYWGNSQRYSVNVFFNFHKFNTNFVTLQAQRIWVRTFLKKHRILIRSYFNWMKVDNLLCNIPIIRLLLNRDYLIRGYEYKPLLLSTYVKHAKLVISTFEYQYNVLGKWWCVIFLDCGDINDRIVCKKFECGVGVGLRWPLSIGPAKLDVAIPLPLLYNLKVNHNFLRFYVTVGPEL